MTLKRILISLYIIPLVVFFATTIIATVADMLGVCYYNDGIIEKCEMWGIDLLSIYDQSHTIGIFSSTRFFIFWILLGGCTMYVMDWLKKRNA